MIETSLISLDEAIQEGQTLSAGMKVILPIKDEAEIYGFIATEDNILSPNIDMPPLGDCLILSNRVISYLNKQQYSFPIFKSLCKAREQKYKLYLLYVPKFFKLSPVWHITLYKDAMSKEINHPRLDRIEGIKIEENVAYYYTNEQDLYFESKSKLRAIGSGFAVVTRRISRPSENIKYEIFDSHSVMIDQK